MIIYLIQAHKNLHQLNRLIALLSSSNSKIFIHLDRKWKLDLSCINSAAIIVKARVDVKWGEWSQVEASIVSLKQIELEIPKYNHVVFLSGQDFPLYPSEYIQKCLKPSTDYIHHQEISENSWACQSRFESFHYHGNSVIHKYAYTFLNKLGVRRKLPLKLKAFGGSSWWCLTQSTIKSILNYIENNSRLNNFFQTTLCSDEFFFQTLVCNLKLSSSIENNNLRFIKFIEDKSNPEILTLRDLDHILTSDALFARKMDPELSNELMKAIALKRQLQS
jgi:hypothetical protein